jgi:NhaA family Na+:H+ antiporter
VRVRAAWFGRAMLQAIVMKNQAHATQTTTDAAHRSDLYGGIGLGLATLAALIVANSSLEQYCTTLPPRDCRSAHLIGAAKLLGQVDADGDLLLLVTLKVEREVCESELASLREATSPVIAASGGFIVPAAIYVSLNRGDADALHGGHPRATDIGFAVGVCACSAVRYRVRSPLG